MWSSLRFLGSSTYILNTIEKPRSLQIVTFDYNHKNLKIRLLNWIEVFRKINTSKQSSNLETICGLLFLLCLFRKYIVLRKSVFYSLFSDFYSDFAEFFCFFLFAISRFRLQLICYLLAFYQFLFCFCIIFVSAAICNISINFARYPPGCNLCFDCSL